MLYCVHWWSLFISVFPYIIHTFIYMYPWYHVHVSMVSCSLHMLLNSWLVEMYITKQRGTKVAVWCPMKEKCLLVNTSFVLVLLLYYPCYEYFTSKTFVLVILKNSKKICLYQSCTVVELMLGKNNNNLQKKYSLRICWCAKQQKWRLQPPFNRLNY